MKFKEFLIKEGVSPSIDDNDVLQTLDAEGIAYTRTKSDKGDLLYTFDNRYSLKYDGSTFILYRSENKVHLMNARNKTEIEKALSTWNGSYSLSTTEITDDDVDDIVAKMKADAAKEDDAESDVNNTDDKSDTNDSDNKPTDDDFYTNLNTDDSNKKGNSK